MWEGESNCWSPVGIYCKQSVQQGVWPNKLLVSFLTWSYILQLRTGRATLNVAWLNLSTQKNIFLIWRHIHSLSVYAISLCHFRHYVCILLFVSPTWKKCKAIYEVAYITCVWEMVLHPCKKGHTSSILNSFKNLFTHSKFQVLRHLRYCPQSPQKTSMTECKSHIITYKKQLILRIYAWVDRWNEWSC